mgnify:CR=1 FL=1
MNKLFTLIAEWLRSIGGADTSGPQDGSEYPEVDWDTLDVSAPDPILGEDPAVDVPVEDPLDPADPHVPRYLWLLDAGHGPGTPGKRSPVLEDGRQFFEYEFNRTVLKNVYARLSGLGVQFVELVKDEDGDLSLTERVKRANKAGGNLPGIFVSVHANASTMGDWETRDIRGTETWYYGSSSNGKRVASAFHRLTLKKLGLKDRGIKYVEPNSKSFYVLRKTTMPAVLLEIGFYTHRDEVLVLLDNQKRKDVAAGIVEAILEIARKGMEEITYHPKVN